MKHKPGIDGQTFKIQLSRGSFGMKDMLTPIAGTFIITKVYKYTRWKRFLLWLGFNVRLYDVKHTVTSFKNKDNGGT